MRMTIFTIGYEGCDIQEFSRFLIAKKIRHLVDVRKNAVSRKKGFSKHKLAAALAEHKISYAHLPALGVPTEWRKRARAGLLTRKKMFSDYQTKILPKARGEMVMILEQGRKNDLVVLCYEADHADCHRSYLAEALVKIGGKNLKIRPLLIMENGVNLLVKK